jgi:hypothetical protein
MGIDVFRRVGCTEMKLIKKNSSWPIVPDKFRDAISRSFMNGF